MKNVRQFHRFIKLTGQPSQLVNPSTNFKQTVPSKSLPEMARNHIDTLNLTLPKYKSDLNDAISLHFIPPRILSKAAIANSESRISVLDMEDAVPQKEKWRTRTLFRSFLNSIQKPHRTRIVVRINPVSQSLDWLRDLRHLALPSVSGFMIAKTEHSGQLAIVDQVLANLELEQNLPQHYFKLCALIETPNGVRNADEICLSDRVDSVIVGNHDLAAMMKCDVESPAMYECFRRIVEAAQRANVDALYGAFSRIDAAGAFIKEAKKLSAMGFRGSACMNKNQLAVVKRDFMTQHTSHVLDMNVISRDRTMSN